MDARNTASVSALPETPQAFVDAMAAAAMGVSIVTTNGAAGLLGLTVSAWSSVSVEPPLLLICVNRKNQIARHITENDHFIVNVLAENHAETAQAFAGKPTLGAPYAFADEHWMVRDEGAVLIGASVGFVCKVDSWHDAGTHRIFMGRVQASSIGTALPLLYHNRSFGRFEKLV